MADYKPLDDRLTGLHDTPQYHGAYPLEAPTSEVSGIVAFLSSTEREGKWALPRRLRVVSVLGNVELDLREADIGVGVSVIEAVAVLGNIEITVPPDVAVETDGDSLLGSFTIKYDGREHTAAAIGHKKVRITGSAYAANVEIMVKGPSEPVLARLGRRLGITEGKAPSKLQ